MVLKLRDFLPEDQFPDISVAVDDQRHFRLYNFAGVWMWDPHKAIPNPLTGRALAYVPDTQPYQFGYIVDSLSECPPYGLHNPLYKPERYVQYGAICGRAAGALADEETADYFARLINVVMPKGYDECMGEVTVVRDFLYNLSGDGCRYLATSFSRPGNRQGQAASGYRWPYGPVAIISPFNFPLEIPALQLMGALAMGNKPVLKPDQRVAVVAEAFVRLLLACGMPKDDMCLFHAGGPATEALVTSTHEGLPLIRLVQFTGSTRVARRLLKMTEGRVRIEDSGYNWKILCPDFLPGDMKTVAAQCDRDAFNASGQKCSAQSILFAHSEWVRAGLWEKLEAHAAVRTLGNLSIGPLLTWSDQRIRGHLKKLLVIPGARLLFGGKPEARIYRIPDAYGCWRPTAVFIPLSQIAPHFSLVTQEVFGPVQIVTEWDSRNDLESIIYIANRIRHHLAGGIVGRDVELINEIAGRTVNGTTYAGIRARTTGAPQWHYFGRAGHPASAGIGTPEAIQSVWSCHREIITDWGESASMHE